MKLNGGTALGWATIVVAVMAALPAAALDENRIGIYTTAEAEGHSMQPPIFTPFDIYFVLTSPRTAAGDTVTACSGFEFRVIVRGGSSLIRMAETPPPGWVNAENASNASDADYRVDGPTPVPVTGDLVVLQVWQFMVTSLAGWHFYLVPLDRPTVPGLLAFRHPGPGETVTEGARNSAGDFDTEVFTLMNAPDPVDAQSFGAVKALYR